LDSLEEGLTRVEEALRRAPIGAIIGDDRVTAGGLGLAETGGRGASLGKSDLERIARPGGTPPTNRQQGQVSFDRHELGIILNVYGKKVAAGEWRDYALDMLRERAMFSIYKRSSERPLYVIEKNPRLARKQGQYLVMGTDGRVLKRGHDLAAVLRVLDPHLYVVK